jgi:predicted RNA binding protein YcfA (HicA-like mRNA interferase family)
MVDGFYKLIIAALKDGGCVFDEHGKGSHEHWRTKDGRLIVVSRNCPSRYLANKIMRDAGLNKRF